VLRGAARLELGDLPGFEADAQALTQLSREHPYYWTLAFAASFRAVRAFLDGRFDDAGTAAADSVSHGAQDPDIFNLYAGQLFFFHREQGRGAEFLPLLVAALEETPSVIGFRAALALTYAEMDQPDEALEQFEQVAADGCARLPRDQAWTISLSLVSETCALLHIPKQAERLYDLLLPHAGHLVCSAWGVFCAGAVDRFLGMLAATQKLWAVAESHYLAALSQEATIAAPAIVARTRYWYGQMLCERRAEGDLEAGVELLSGARSTAQALGMARLAGQAGELLATCS
jgi:hypothetical protein